MSPNRMPIAIVVRYVTTSGQSLVLTFAVPYTVDVALMTRGAPPAGVWRLQHEPGPMGNLDPPYERRGDKPADDIVPGAGLPDSFWHDGIPF